MRLIRNQYVTAVDFVYLSSAYDKKLLPKVSNLTNETDFVKMMSKVINIINTLLVYLLEKLEVSNK